MRVVSRIVYSHRVVGNGPCKARKLPRQDRSRRLVATILDATARILARDGYAQLSTNAVADIAGVSIGSLYQYFPNRDALVTAVVERHGERVHATIVAAVGEAAPSSLAEAVRRIVAAVVTAHRIDPELHAVLEAEMPKLRIFDGHAGTVRAIAGQLAALPPPLLAEIRARDPAHAAAVVGEMVHALVHAALIPPKTSALTAAEIEEETVRAVLAYLTWSAPRSLPRRHPHPH